jgi:hypothetical protein
MQLLPEPLDSMLYIQRGASDDIAPTFAFRLDTSQAQILSIAAINQRIGIYREGDVSPPEWRIMGNIGIIDDEALKKHLALPKTEREVREIGLRRAIDLVYRPEPYEEFLFDEAIELAKHYQLVLVGNDGGIRVVVDPFMQILSVLSLEWHEVPRF